MTNPKTDPEILAFFTPDAVQICESEAPVSEWHLVVIGLKGIDRAAITRALTG